jgi:transposase
MRATSLWRRLLAVEGFVVEGVEFNDDKHAVIVRVRPKHRYQNRCPHCEQRCPGYDRGTRRRWRSLDAVTSFIIIEADAPRVQCRSHGVVVAAVPWARHDSLFTKPFEDQVAWLAARMDKTSLAKLMRITWRTVGNIIERVTSEIARKIDRFGNVRRIGVDEVAYRKGHRFLTVVVDHDTGRLIWAHEGKGEEALKGFFEALGEEGRARIELVSVDAAPWFVGVLRSTFPNADVCIDPFHVVKWANEALDKTRREMWRELQRRRGQGELATVIKGLRWALCKNPEDLTEGQRAKLDDVEKLNQPLYRGYLLKEQLREVFKLRSSGGVELLKLWLEWQAQSGLNAFTSVGKSIRHHWDGIVASLEHGLTNARVEALNNQLRLLTRIGFGHHSAEAVIALAMLRVGGLCPSLPGRT